jgi:hypothetical protein
VANSTGALFVLPLKIPVTLLPFPAANTIVIQQMTTMPKTNFSYLFFLLSQNSETKVKGKLEDILNFIGEDNLFEEDF